MGNGAVTHSFLVRRLRMEHGGGMSGRDMSNIRGSARAHHGRVVRAAWVLLLIGLGGGSWAQPETGSVPLTVGIIPAFSAERLVATFEPMVDALAEVSGIPLRMETAPDIEEFARRTLADRRYDLLLTAPHLYVDAARRGGYRLLVRVDAEGLRVLVVVRKGSTLRDLHELTGKRVATMEPMALVSVQGTAMLRDVGLEPTRDVMLVETPNMDAALQAMFREHVDAAFVVNTYFEERLQPEMRAHLRVLGMSDLLPHLPISAAPWLDEKIAEQLAAALTHLHLRREGEFVLRKLGWRGFVRASQDEYAAAAKLLKNMRSPLP